MTPELRDALRLVAQVQLKVAASIASTQGADVAAEMNQAWQSLLTALETHEPEPEKSAVFGERLFTPKKRKKKEAS